MTSEPLPPDDADEEYDEGDLTPEEWMQFICHCFRDELSDPREDIYILEDGQPVECSEESQPPGDP